MQGTKDRTEDGLEYQEVEGREGEKEKRRGKKARKDEAWSRSAAGFTLNVNIEQCVLTW